MPTEIVPLTPDLLSPLVRFAERVWTRPRSEAFYRWRYVDPAFHVAYVAMRDGECLAMESAFRRPWRVDGEIVDFLEVFDWYCLPELRNSGLGVRIMQRFMRDPHPLLLVGGTRDTQGLLPRLGWKIPCQSSRWALPLGEDRAARALARKLRLPLAVARAAAPVALALQGRRPRRWSAPPGGRVLPVATLGAEALALERAKGGYAARPLWTPGLLGWLIAGYPGAGHFVPLYFTVARALRGFALLRIHPAQDGCDAEIIDLCAEAPDADLYAWMVSEVVACASAFRPGHVATSTTCAAVAEALRRNRFVTSEPNPVQVWWPGGRALPSNALIASNTGDSPILPLVERWWDGSGDADGPQISS